MIGVIADDLSGAAEIGAIGLRFGLRAEILLDSKLRLNRSRRNISDLICIDTDSRSCPPNEAAHRAAIAAKTLRKAGAKWIYKKVDSVLRGNVLAEIRAIAQTISKNGAANVLLHPANPSLGRTIRDGKYFVRGKLIHKTEFARDPAHPRWTADVCALLDRNGAEDIRVGKSRGHLPNAGIAICESASSRDVKRWAERADAASLPAGGGEFFAALLAVRHGAPASRPAKTARRNSLEEMRALPNRELFVCGSTSESSKAFISAARRNGTPIFSLPREIAWGADFTRAAAKSVSKQIAKTFETESRVILQIGLRAVRDAAVARKLSGYLIQLAETVLGCIEISHVFAEGGATAVELARRMGWTQLQVVREVAPGVATLAVNGDNALQFTVKPGTYVWPDEIQRPSAALKKQLV
jgi:uncharacterized protein YgbK (DUF1537 family)